MERASLIHGIQESSSTRGTSSHQQNPAVLLCERGCTETNGFCMGAVFMYSGGFQTQIERDQLDQVRSAEENISSLRGRFSSITGRRLILPSMKKRSSGSRSRPLNSAST